MKYLCSNGNKWKGVRVMTDDTNKKENKKATGQPASLPIKKVKKVKEEQPPAKITIKELNIQRIIDYYSNPDNPPKISRKKLATKVLGYNTTAMLYKMFEKGELCEIEWRALTERRKRYAPYIAKVDHGILEKGATGDAPAAKLAYQRFEAWNEKTTTELELKLPMLEKILGALPEEYAEKVREALLKKAKK
jgi:hypothetical protein